jgi:hypothetical protein
VTTVFTVSVIIHNAAVLNDVAPYQSQVSIQFASMKTTFLKNISSKQPEKVFNKASGESAMVEQSTHGLGFESSPY